MFKIIILTISQCLLLASGQVCFKLAVDKINKFEWTSIFFLKLLTNWWLLVSGIFLILASILWGYIIKHFDFSIVYPITAITYIFGMLAAVFIFQEAVPLIRWVGVGVIIAGVILIVS